MDPTSSSDEPAPRFCDQCAASLVPLSVPHVARTCNTCQRTIHLVEPGDDGKGLKIRKGDTFTIPAGAITMSLDPTKSTGRFFRPGLTWFVRRILTGDLPTTAEGLDALTTTWEQVADEILVNSEKLTGYDLDDEQDAEKAIELIKQDQRSIEFWALTVGSLCHDLRDRLASEEERAAALSALRLATFWAMLVFVGDLEDHVWTGYNQNQLIYGIAKAGAQTPAEAAAIAALEPAFKRLGEAVLTAWVEAGVDIGPRLGVTGVEEPLLKALAQYHLSLFERQRSQRQLETENRVRFWTLVGGSFTAGAAVTGAVLAILKVAGITYLRVVESASGQPGGTLGVGLAKSLRHLSAFLRPESLWARGCGKSQSR